MKLDLDAIEATARKAQEYLLEVPTLRWEDFVSDDYRADPASLHAFACSPDVVLALVARVRYLEKRCHIVESHPPDFMLEGEPLETQVFILKERLLDERHKSYQLEHELAAAELHIEVCSQAAFIAKGQCSYCDEEHGDV